MKQKNDKVVSTLVFFLGLISVLFVISFIFNFFGGFELKTAETFDRILGEDVTIVMPDYGSQSVSLSFSGKSLPGDEIKQKIQVKLPNLDLNNYVFRVKAYIGQSQPNSNLKLSGFDFWDRNEQDGYYYFVGEIQKLQEIGVCTDLILPQNLSLKSNVNYSLIFTAELVIKNI